MNKGWVWLDASVELKQITKKKKSIKKGTKTLNKHCHFTIGEDLCVNFL